MINKVTLLGNLGADVEMRYMPNGTAVATLSVATTISWKDKESGDKKEETEWHRVTMFGKLAEIANEYIKKGSKVYLEGRIKTSKYNKDGVDHYSTGIIADVMKMLDAKPEGSSIRAGQQQARPADNFDDNYGSMSDDIPFMRLQNVMAL